MSACVYCSRGALAECLCFAFFDDTAALHDDDSVREIADQRHGMGDEEVGHAVLALQRAQQVHDLRADADIEG